MNVDFLCCIQLIILPHKLGRLLFVFLICPWSKITYWYGWKNN